MLTFKEFLLEQIRFQKAKDVDYDNGSNEVLCLEPDDGPTYNIRGKTHGMYSHACKHYKEFNPEDAKAIIDAVRKIIRKKIDSNPRQFCDIYVQSYGYKELKPKNALSMATDGAILNLLDLLNDMQKADIRMTQIQTEVFERGLTMKKNYEAIINGIMKNSIDIDTFKTPQDIEAVCAKSKVIRFRVKHANVDKTIYLDLKKNAMVVEGKPNEIRTAFVYSYESANYKQTLYNCAMKHRNGTYYSKVVREFFGNMLNGQ